MAPPNILIVEDEVIIARDIQAQLDEMGYAVAGNATTGDEAIALTGLLRPDLVLMDMMMPVLDGLEATRRFRATEPPGQPRTPILAMTARATPADRDLCIASGMDDYLSKPFDVKAFQLMVQRYVPRHSGPAPRNPTLAPTTAPTLTSALAASADPAEFDYASALCEVDQEVVGIVSAIFVRRWPLELAKFQTALAAGDREAVLHIAHALKGTLGLFGARPAAGLARQIEEIAEQGRLDGMAALFNRLGNEVARLLQALANHP